ncbi:ribosome-associated heat shock protein Hsp15 [Alishewanella sp. 16-MA]|uniref:Heat shock protein 15 n=1 Tax=Alishewanella maricola TaxID=2795740 RepID=A0ABS8C4K6_9ALTE|nr:MULTISPECIES: ribosome-associated heat shock protein Hsp15 [Gammaproteobacteria]MDP4945606.1 ribosome-associated heat shock protein Hsp15 [Alishewanella sp.]MDP5206775.1 ribosome-associated heat shock protein Hsp15 [Alishewanella sp. SMS9]MCB5227256.1 ribosome-associated heat shock protein Hsp15 [Alishewanella maricola]MCC5452158.1 ribosome-associated heat shock protein Hsp15 [Rheinheimera sp. UJ51]MCF4010715.1 ribosome-associated heat shock protein Hsp15 [Rheinheimera sp. UJ63]
MTTQHHTDKKAPQNIRLDKWLWGCRFYKTRALAKDMIDGGKVHYNGQRCKSSRQVEIGATIRLAQGVDEKIVIVTGLTEKRLAAPLAQQLYEETAESTQRRAERAELRKTNSLFAPHPDTKPDKKERRQLLLLKSQQ